MSLELGCLHPDYLLERLTRAQLNQWYAYATLEPVGNPVEVIDKDEQRKQVQGKFRNFFQNLKRKQDGG